MGHHTSSRRRCRRQSLSLIDEEDWRQPLIDYLEHKGCQVSQGIKQKSNGEHHTFFIITGRCIDALFSVFGSDAWIMKKESKWWKKTISVYVGRISQSQKLHDRVITMGYYWHTMVCDCIDFARKYDTCQLHANFIHQPSKPLHPTVASWSFEAWGLDVVGPFTQKSFTRTYTFWQLQIIFPNGRRKSF